MISKVFLTIPVLALLATGAQANLIVNGNFETDSFSYGGADAITSLSGWNIEGVGNIAGIGDTYLGGSSQKIDLSGYADAAGSGIDQTISTVASGSYSVSFDMYVPFSGTATLLVNNVVVASGLGNGAHSFTFTGTGSDNIKFLSDGNGNTNHLDNVSVEAVPEPASMLALGVGALALVRRRRLSK